MFFFDEDSGRNEALFESIKHVNEYGQEFWYARELQKVLEYTEWRNFLKVIAKAQDACENSGMPVNECFVEVNKTSPMPHGGTKPLDDVMLSRYACYLIAMNGDPSKEVIALAQTYFSVSTRITFAPSRAAVLIQMIFRGMSYTRSYSG